MCFMVICVTVKKDAFASLVIIYHLQYICKLGSLYLIQSLTVITQYLPHRVSKFHENAVQLITNTTCELQKCAVIK